MGHDMSAPNLQSLLKQRTTVEKDGIFVSKEIANKTVWDDLAVENPTHAVISAKDEADAAAKSEAQISDMMRFVKEGDVLLDCGTGYGRVAKYLLPKLCLGGYIGVDSSYQMLSLFKQRYSSTEAEQGTPLLLLNADIHTLPLETDSVDVAIVCAVFLHNHKSIIEKAMNEVKRVVKPGGKVLVYSSFPRTMTAMGMQGHAYQMLLNLMGQPFKNGPVRYYRGKEVKRMFDGFEKVELVPVGFNVLPKTLIFLPRPIETVWRVGIANPVNSALERVTPKSLRRYFAVHYDVVAHR